MGLQHYVNARLWAFRENINDIVTAVQNGYWEDVIHFIGAEGESYLSWRMMVRRAWARKTLFNPNTVPPNLPPYGSIEMYEY